MTFFYDLNKKLNSIRELPETTYSQLNEAAKPDFLDIDKDGNKKEPMKKAVADKKAGQQGMAEGRNTNNPVDDMVEDYLDWLGARHMLTKRREEEKAQIMSDLKSGYLHPNDIDYATSGGQGMAEGDQSDSARNRRAKEAHEQNLDAAHKELRQRDAEGEDMSQYRVNPRTYKIEKKAVAEGDHSYMPSGNDIAGKSAGKENAMDKMKKFVKKVANKVAPDDETLMKDLVNKTGGSRKVKEGADSVDAILRRHAKAVNDFKNGADLDYDLESDLYDYYFNQGDIKNYNADASEYIADRLADELGLAESNFDSKKISTGTVYTRKYDADSGETTGTKRTDNDAKRGRGRPKANAGNDGEVMKPDFSAFGVGKVNLPKDKNARKIKGRDTRDTVDEETLDEKAVSKKQQKFMGMVHAAQKGKEPASKKVANVAKSMKSKDATDFAATKHKGLPVKKKKDEAVEETTVSGSVAPAADKNKSGGGYNFGGGIYDSMNRDLEDMIAESMARLDESLNINMSMNNDDHSGPRRSLTVTATDDDAEKLGMLMKMAGLGTDYSADMPEEELEQPMEENEPDYPTNTVTSDDAFQYSGGLNKPKRDVAGDGQATGQVTAVSSVDHDNNEDLDRMMEMAGVKKKEVEEEKTAEGNKFTGNLAKARAAGKTQADLDGDGDLEKVKESILDLSRMWKSYKG